MPLYEYICKTCQATEERIQPMSAPDQHECVECGDESGMQRIVSRGSFVLQGF